VTRVIFWETINHSWQSCFSLFSQSVKCTPINIVSTA